MMLRSVRPGPAADWVNGPTIVAKTHAKIGMTAHLSRIGVEHLARPNSKECIEALDILTLYWRPRWIAPDSRLGSSCLPLELYRTEISDRRVPAFRIVEALDVVEHICSCFIARPVNLSLVRSFFSDEK